MEPQLTVVGSPWSYTYSPASYSGDYPVSYPVTSNSYNNTLWRDTVVVTVTGALIITCILIAGSAILGSNTDRYNQITVPSFNPYYLTVILLFTLALQEILVVADLHLRVCNRYQAMVLILIGALLLFLWTVTFFHVVDIGASIWTSGFLVIYQFLLFFYFFYQSPLSSVLILATLGFSIYLFYEMIHIASINNVTV